MSPKIELSAILCKIKVIFRYQVSILSRNKHTYTHILFDVYSKSSLKAETRAQRALGGRRKVTTKNAIPSSWHNFLRHDDNKTELYQFLADRVAQMSAENTVFVTKGSAVLSTQEADLEGLQNCTHEEADSRNFVHASHS